jgi:hypothetical protein
MLQRYTLSNKNSVEIFLLIVVFYRCTKINIRYSLALMFVNAHIFN